MTGTESSGGVRVGPDGGNAPGPSASGAGPQPVHHSSGADSDPRLVAFAFDAVVRAPLMAEASAHAIAERFMALWAASGWGGFGLSATALLVDGKVALEMSRTDHPWILPAFMAGLRTFRPRADLRMSQLRSFCEELHGLSSDVAVIERFRDWLWGDGAEGFQVVVMSSLVEAADAAVLEDAARSLRLARPRDGRVESMALDARLLSSRDLDLAVQQETMQAPLEALLEGGSASSRPLPGDDFKELAERCDDGFLWAAALVDGALEVPALRRTIPPERLGRHAALLLSNQVDARALEFIARLGELADGYGRLVARSLDDGDLGKAISTRIPATPESVSVLGRVATIAPPKLLAGLAAGLVDRATRDGQRPWVVEVVRELTIDRLHASVNLGTFSTEQLSAYAGVIREVAAGTAILRSVFVALPSAVAARFYGSLPDDLALELLDAALGVAASREPREQGPVLERLAALDEATAAASLGRLLRASAGRAWPPRLLHVVTTAVARRVELQHEVLAPMVRDGDLEPAVRLAALRSIQDRRVLAEAVAWRLGEVLDPPELRSQLKAFRAEARAAT